MVAFVFGAIVVGFIVAVAILSGKTRRGRAFSRRLKWRFADISRPGRSLTIAAIERRALAEFFTHARISAVGHVAIPTRATVHLHPNDFATVRPLEKQVPGELADAAEDHARRKGWHLATKPRFELELDPSAPQGIPVIDVSFVEPTVTLERPPKTQRLNQARLIPLQAGLAEVSLEGSLILGRDPTACQLVIDDRHVSARHCRIFYGDDSWAIEDLGSTNGTYVNDEKVARLRPLPPRAQIRLGKSVVYEFNDSEPSGRKEQARMETRRRRDQRGRR
jgi:hypothetical protein